MSKIKHQLLIKFLKLFIKSSDLTPEQDQTLFETLGIIINNEPVPKVE